MTRPHKTIHDSGPVRVYRRLIAVYPPAFRATFGDSMAADLNDGLHDARQSGASGEVAVLLARVVCDLIWSAAVQWLKTCVPWLTAAYATALVCVCEGLASGGPFRWLFVLTLLPVVSTITFTLWFLLPQIRQHRSRPLCLTSRD